MQIFFTDKIEAGFAHLDEEESRHLVTVLRRRPGDRLRLTDGRGAFYDGELAETGKRHALVRLITREEAPRERPARLHLAIAPTKQIERLEWLLEKATELGIDEITPLLCQRSERETVRLDRLEKVLLSAMKQSLRAYLPRLHALTPFKKLVTVATEAQKRVAWCSETPLPYFMQTVEPEKDLLVLIGPEGDFTAEEVALAEANGFLGISLGTARLRTETAGLFVVAGINSHHAMASAQRRTSPGPS
jgi:16S rRNA (uracil1498-N3)-methyltransferase